VVKEEKVELLLEVKTSDEKISTALKYYKQKLVPKQSVQVLLNEFKHSEYQGVQIINVIDFVQKKGCFLS
jgi:hypothetical protein